MSTHLINAYVNYHIPAAHGCKATRRHGDGAHGTIAGAMREATSRLLNGADNIAGIVVHDINADTWTAINWAGGAIPAHLAGMA